MILLIQTKATPDQIQTMLAEYGAMIKLAVDIRRGVLAGGGEMYADCEQVLLRDGSEQDDIWGANWYPEDQRVEFEALINIRPLLGNRGLLIQSQPVRHSLTCAAFPNRSKPRLSRQCLPPAARSRKRWLAPHAQSSRFRRV